MSHFEWPGNTFTSDITISNDDFPAELGWELLCDDGVHYVGYTTNYPHGGISADASRSSSRGDRNHDAGAWLENVVFQDGATCKIDLYDDWGDGWQGGQWSVPDLPAPNTFEIPYGHQTHGPYGFEFKVGTYVRPPIHPPIASPPPAPPAPPPSPQVPGIEYQLGSTISGDVNADGIWGLALNQGGTVFAVNVNAQSGIARVYDYNNGIGDWAQRGLDILAEPGGASSHFWAGDNPGHSIALNADGTIVAVGGHANDGGAYWGREGSPHIGVVRVHQWDSTSGAWVQMGQDIDGEREYDWFGWALDLSSDGTVLAVGSSKNRGDQNQHPEQGHVRVFKWDPDTTPDPWYDGAVGGLVGGDQPGAWVQMGQDIDGVSSVDANKGRQGLSVALSADGNVVIAGVPFADRDSGHEDSGLARVYAWDPDTTPSAWYSHEALGMVGGDQPGAWVKRGNDLDLSLIHI